MVLRAFELHFSACPVSMHMSVRETNRVRWHWCLIDDVLRSRNANPLQFHAE